MNTASIRKILESTNGRTFTVHFVKKDGTVRKINCRTNVRKYLKGGESTIAGKPNLLSVFDMQKKAYRCINLDTIIDAKVDGVEIQFK